MATLQPDDFALVRSTRLFRAISDADLHILINNSVPVEYSGKTILYQQGDKATHYYVVLDGIVKLFRLNYEGEETVIHIFGRGDTFAECTMFFDAIYPVNAEIVVRARLLRMETSVMRRVVNDRPNIAHALLDSVSCHMDELMDKTEQMKVHTATQRVAKFLLGLTDARSGSVEFELPYEKVLIANSLGMQPASLSRALARLRSLNVSTDNERVIIGDVAQLADYLRRGVVMSPDEARGESEA